MHGDHPSQPVRVIVHAGFHKTGTSSLQDYFRAHRKLLAGHATIYLKADFLEAGNLGRIYGLKPYPWRKRQFRHAFRRFLKDVPADPVIFISWEGFCGVMPGHRRWLTGQIETYTRTAIPLARTMAHELRRQFGKRVEIEFLYTVRDTESWIRSVYGHLVRSIRIDTDFDGFRNSFSKIPDLKAEAAAIARALSPMKVHTARLEDIGATPQGPATALLDLIDLSKADRANLPKAARKNMALSPNAEAMFLRLNREINNAVDLKLRKTRIAEQDRKARP